MMESVAEKIGAPKRRIIAVGGAKGGVGKSLVAANIGVYLASLGKKTVLVDLDLGAANLHLYLGVWGLKYRIDDYLDKKVPDLASIAVPTQYGPLLIGGGSSRLGSANLPHTRKLKMMRAIRKMDADYVILDLGASTTFNILDFFLLADAGLVMTTCDPAAYLDAYTFIKMALYRRLVRLFGAESVFHKFKDEQLQAVINGFVAPNDNNDARYISDLLTQIEAQAPQRSYLVREAIAGFQPHLVVNMTQNRAEVNSLIQRMQLVSQRMLNMRIECAGSIPSDRLIAKSAHDLKPEVASHPNGELARRIAQILRHINIR
jgi:flagellar biosynthesis protein FlhG